MTTSAPITERRYIALRILVTTLFFLWALGVNLNDVLIPHIRVAFMVPLICHAYVLYFAVRGYRPVLVAGPRAAELRTGK